MVLHPNPPPIPGRKTRTNDDRLVSGLRQLRDCDYYWGPLDVSEAEEKLSNQPTGAFLLRDSSDDRHLFTLSFKLGDEVGVRLVHHIRICYSSSGVFSFAETQHGYNNIMDLIHNTVTQSRNKTIQFFLKARLPYEAPLPVSILYPISRNHVVHSLMHLCRFRILKIVRHDHIEKLQLPYTLTTYLQASQYYVEHKEGPLPVCNIEGPPPLPYRPPGQFPPPQRNNEPAQQQQDVSNQPERNYEQVA